MLKELNLTIWASVNFFHLRESRQRVERVESSDKCYYNAHDKPWCSAVLGEASVAFVFEQLLGS